MSPEDLNGRPWLQTGRGLAWCADDPESFEYDAKEIASALSLLCRFAGHFMFYSVAQHSVIVAREVARHTDDKKVIATALLHDAAEAFCADVPSPLKRMPELAGYRKVIARTERAIAEHFGLGPVLRHPLIKHADLVVLATEKRDLVPRTPLDAAWAELPPPREERIVPVGPLTSRGLFLNMWDELW